MILISILFLVSECFDASDDGTTPPSCCSLLQSCFLLVTLSLPQHCFLSQPVQGYHSFQGMGRSDQIWGQSRTIWYAIKILKHYENLTKQANQERMKRMLVRTKIYFCILLPYENSSKQFLEINILLLIIKFSLILPPNRSCVSPSS